MKTITSQLEGTNVVRIVSPETIEDMTYLCNIAVAQKMYVDDKSMFYKLLDYERNYITSMVVLMVDERICGISIVWDFITRFVDNGTAASADLLKDYGYIQHAIGVYIAQHQRRRQIGAMLVNMNMDLHLDDAFCIGNSYPSQQFWSSSKIDHSKIKFMLVDDYKSKVSF